MSVHSLGHRGEQARRTVLFPSNPSLPFSVLSLILLDHDSGGIGSGILQGTRQPQVCESIRKSRSAKDGWE